MQIHPSVIMSISEHHTRTLAIRQPPIIVIGALLGKRTDQNIEIVDSFELRLIVHSSTTTDTTATSTTNVTDNPRYEIDTEFYMKKLPLVKQVFPDLDIIGWYATSMKSGDNCEPYLCLNDIIREMISYPIFLKLNPYQRETDAKISGSLPLKVYKTVDNHTYMQHSHRLGFEEVPWTIVTEDVEIIGLEHNAKMTHVNVTPSAAIDNLRLQHSAVKMLKDRIRLISKFVKDVHSGSLEYHESTIADIAKLCKQFPIMKSENYSQAYNIQCNDVALNTYLGILTKGSMCKMHYGMSNSKTRAFSTTHAHK